MPSHGRLQACEPGPLGVQVEPKGLRFTVFAGHAEAVELCLFEGERELRRLSLPDCTDGLWHGLLEGGRPGLQYGYRVFGPYEPARGLRYNHHKLLLDPYARRLAGQIRWHDALYAYRIGSAKQDLSFDRRDSAPYMTRAVVVDETFDWGEDRPPRVPWADTVIYELHVRGFSRRNEAVPADLRGSFAGLANAASIEHLKRLGVTAVELLPIHAFVRDRHLLDRNLTNYWGYNSLAWFAPEPTYLATGDSAELKGAIKALHAAGIEVILDVVYNHSCEGNELGPTLFLRGFDNLAYYRLLPDNPRHYVNDTGCGNALDFSHPRVIQLALDSLRWWVAEYHVDGFRFDLGVTLGREAHGFDPGCGFFDALLQDPLLSRVKLISEPWDVGLGGYQLGRHPAGMAEWNARFRDDVRRYWRGDPNQRGAIAARVMGSADLFDHDRRRPWASINFVTAHDGFTLEDLVSYNHKHNEANGEDNRDGADQNDSCNWGAEGPEANEAVRACRERVKRNILATLLFAHGTPMLLAGDEFGQTQRGNNNAYCQDNPLSWLDWSLLQTPRGAALADFTARMVALRHRHPVLRGWHFQHAHHELAPGIRDVAWFDERGEPLREEDWNKGFARLLVVRRAQGCVDGSVEIALLLANADTAPHVFRLPPPRLPWEVLVDTGEEARVGRLPVPVEYEMRAHSLALMVARLPHSAAANPCLPGEPARAA